MKFFNLGVSEIIFIIIIALIIFGPGNMVKTAREAGAFIRKVTKSPYWKEVWATKREIDELPRMLREEAHLDETIKDLNKESASISNSIAASMSDLIKEVNQPLNELESKAKTAVKEAEVKVNVEKPAADPVPNSAPDGISDN